MRILRIMKTSGVTVLWLLFCSWAVTAHSSDAHGYVNVDIQNVLGHSLTSHVVLYHDSLPPQRVNVPSGQGQATLPAGEYTARVYVEQAGLPYLVDIQTLVVGGGTTSDIALELVEGATDITPLRDFDADNDLALDAVEAAAGTAADDPADYPGAEPITFESPVLRAEAGWYKGELHAISSYSRGQFSVDKLVRRAERLGLDFLAIADRNTLASVNDGDYESNKTVLIPAMEWGDEEHGIALLYGPRTVPPPAVSDADVRAVRQRIQAQGGLFVIAHPCFPTMLWQRDVPFANAVQTWCRGYNEVPGAFVDELMPKWRARGPEGRLQHAIALAIANPLRKQGGERVEVPPLSANGQAVRYLDFQLSQGFKMTMVGGSMVTADQGDMGNPTTHVFARELSVDGILEGLRLGRTYISREPDGPEIIFGADVLANGTMDIMTGGMFPLDVETNLVVQVRNARGHRMQLLENGLPIRSLPVDEKVAAFTVRRQPQTYSVYRVRILSGEVLNEGFGPVEVIAMTGPIYAQAMVPYDPRKGPEQFWLNLEPDLFVPPMQPPDEAIPPALAPSRF